MHRTIVSFGVVMIALGLIAYFATGMASVTALIPSFFGIIIAGLGLLHAKLGKGAVIAAIVLSLLGAGGPAARVLPAAIRGELEINAATVVQIGFMVLALVLVVVLIAGLLKKPKSA